MLNLKKNVQQQVICKVAELLSYDFFFYNLLNIFIIKRARGNPARHKIQFQLILLNEIKQKIHSEYNYIYLQIKVKYLPVGHYYQCY